MHQTVRQLLNVPDPGSIKHTRLTYRPDGGREKNMGQYNMKVTTENAINKHFDQAAERIRMMAMPDAKDRLLIANEEERGKYLQEFRKAGEIKVRAVGQEWELILDSEVYRIRKMSGLSRKDFAEKYHIPIRTLEKWERSEITPAEYLIEWLARLVKIDTEGAE